MVFRAVGFGNVAGHDRFQQRGIGQAELGQARMYGGWFDVQDGIHLNFRKLGFLKFYHT